MTTYSKRIFSGSTDGKPVPITTSASAGDTIHTAGTSTTAFDEIWAWAANTSNTSSKVTVEFGGTETGALMEVSIPGEYGLTTLLPGLPIQNGKIIRAFCTGTTNIVNVFGFVNRII